jgi:hypothetical protein
MYLPKPRLCAYDIHECLCIKPYIFEVVDIVLSSCDQIKFLITFLWGFMPMCFVA